MNSIGYEKVLKRCLLPIYEAHNVFQQDGVSCHKSRLVTSFLDNSKICLLSDWSSVSRDINIIGPLWADLKARVSSCKPTNIEELWRSCEEQWVMIPVPKIKKSLSRHFYEDQRGFEEERTKYTLLIKCIVVGGDVSSL